MRSEQTLLLAIIVLALIGTACTGSGSGGSLNPTPSTSLAPSLRSAPQPANCPRHWDFSPVAGSGQTLVPGTPTAAVTCSGRRYVHAGTQLTQLVHMLNSRRHIDPTDCIHNLGGVVLDMTQMYFNYPNGDIQVVNFDPNCRTVSNGKLTARFGQVTS
jgi:hypothetical protein